ncbi:MAG: FAD-dependent oxidoreductase [Halofilum sp. (in: g-proteobacteria)]|nr:FAD-dependent oxidoreductase [Halofilum sp. (in: g-proteobacteria)]
MAHDQRDIVIIGAGIVGVCCARWLQREGHRVHLVDAGPPGHGCSWGNAGTIPADQILPVATAQTLRALPRMLADPTGPLAVRWSYLPRMAPWFLRFLLNTRPARVRANTAALAALCAEAMAGYGPLVEGRSAAELMAHTGWVTAFETAKGLAGARADVARKQAYGIEAEWLDRDGLRARVPQLGEHVAGGVWYPDTWMVADPGEFTARLAADVVADGGRIDELRVTGLEPAGERVRVRTAAGALEADQRDRRRRRPLAPPGAHARRRLPARYRARLPRDAARSRAVAADAGDGGRAQVRHHAHGGRAAPGRHRRARRPRAAARPAPRAHPGRARRAPVPGAAHAGMDGLDGLSPDVPGLAAGDRTLAALARRDLRLRPPAPGPGAGRGSPGAWVADELAGRQPPVDLAPLRADRF